MHDRVTLGRKTLLVVLQYIIGTAVGLICIALPAKYFSVSVFGLVVGIGFSLFHLLVFFSDLGLKQTHMGLSQSYDFADCNSSYALSKAILAVLSSLVFLLIIFVSGTQTYVMLIFLFCALLFTLRDLPIGIFDSRIETRKSQSSLILEHASRLLLTVALTLIAIGKSEEIQAIYLSLTFLFSMLASTIFALFLLRGYPFGKPKYVKQYFSSAPAIAFMGGIDIIMLNADKLILQFFVSSEEIGIYTGVNKIAQLVFYLSTALITILLPAVAARDDRGATEATSFAERYLMMVILPIAFMSIVLRGDIIRYLLPQETFLGGSASLVLLMLSTLLLAGSRSEAILLFGRNRKREATQINAALALLYLASTALLSGFYGIDGAAFAALLSGLFSFIVFRYECKRMFGKLFIGMSLLKQFIAVLITSVILLFLGFFDPGEMVFLFFLFRMAAGIVIYAFLLILFRELRLEDLVYAMELIGGKGEDKHSHHGKK